MVGLVVGDGGGTGGGVGGGVVVVALVVVALVVVWHRVVHSAWSGGENQRILLIKYIFS